MQMLVKDQDLRRKRMNTFSVDRENLLALQQIIQKHGWPTYLLVGKKGAHAAWILVQHADSSLSFQKHCLVLLRHALDQNQANPMHLAYLTDRILVHQRKKQLYGTQFYLDKNRVFRPRPIAQETTLDQRRLKMDLPPFKKYLAAMKRIYSQFRDKK